MISAEDLKMDLNPFVQIRTDNEITPIENSSFVEPAKVLDENNGSAGTPDTENTGSAAPVVTEAVATDSTLVGMRIPNADTSAPESNLSTPTNEALGEQTANGTDSGAPEVTKDTVPDDKLAPTGLDSLSADSAATNAEKDHLHTEPSADSENPAQAPEQAVQPAQTDSPEPSAATTADDSKDSEPTENSNEPINEEKVTERKAKPGLEASVKVLLEEKQRRIAEKKELGKSERARVKEYIEQETARLKEYETTEEVRIHAIENGTDPELINIEKALEDMTEEAA
jgi:hypothetical protein